MRFRGAFRVVRRVDRALPTKGLPAGGSRSVLAGDASLDARIWPHGGSGPLLLVNAPRKAGGAVRRNLFRRRVRMALLQLLRETPPARPFVLWVRPMRGTADAGRIPFNTILGQLRLALRRLEGP